MCSCTAVCNKVDAECVLQETRFSEICYVMLEFVVYQSTSVSVLEFVVSTSVMPSEIKAFFKVTPFNIVAKNE